MSESPSAYGPQRSGEPVSSPAEAHEQTEHEMRIGEEEFRLKLAEVLKSWSGYGCVTGPGRSGAVASVYASHLTGLPWVPFGTRVPESLWPVLIVDTAAKSGRTLRRAIKLHGPSASGVAVYSEPPRLRFWYER